MSAVRDERAIRLAEVERLRGEERFEEARELLLGLCAAYPEDDGIAYLTACLHDRMGRETEAVALYERALRGAALGDEDRRGALLGLGSTLRVLGRYDEAVATLRAGVARYPEDGGLRTFLAMALYNVGNHHDAVRELLTLLATTSTDPSVREYRRAITHYARDLDATE